MITIILIKKKKATLQDGSEMEYIEDIHDLGFQDLQKAKEYASKTLKEEELPNVYFAKINVVEDKLITTEYLNSFKPGSVSS